MKWTTSESDKISVPLRIAGIGASAGGLEAFTELLKNLPTHGRIAYVLVQHLDPTHRSMLSELLGRSATLPVREIEDNTRVQSGEIYVIPPNKQMTIRRGVLKLSKRLKDGGPARSIDHFLQSLATDQKEKAIGVILSGAGSDGAKGLKAIKNAGGITFAQDAGSAKYDSMPRSAVGTDCVDFVLPPAKIASEISRLLLEPGTVKSRAAANARTRRGQVSRKRDASGVSVGPEIAWPAPPADLNLRKIFLLLRTKIGIDFTLYRPTTIGRRIQRRLGINRLKDLESYLQLLRENPGEIEALHQDLLLNVSSFFRNPGVFELLKKNTFPKLAKNGPRGEALRFWVAGCSTGQEAYSLAMAYSEFREGTEAPPLQIFATDVNIKVLDAARAGRFTEAQVQSVSPGRRQRFFIAENGGFRVQKQIRDMVVFAQHNLLTDPPFTRVDMITCRNLLIYFEPALQQRVLPSFHYALKPGGFLVLGASESIGHFSDFFDAVEKSQKIYQKKAVSAAVHRQHLPLQVARATVNAVAVRRPESGTVDAYREADRVTLSKYAPAGVLITEEGEILQFRGDAQDFLELPAGKANFHLLKMARDGLALTLQRLLLRAKRESRPVREKEIHLPGRRGLVTVEIVPLKNLATRCFLVLFEKIKAPVTVPSIGTKRVVVSKLDEKQLSGVKRDLVETREQFENLREEYDTSVEELQASNEEVQSANEELQSLNEELETSNEELESANEELTTLNEELATRNAELKESELRLREQAELLELAPVLARSVKGRIIFWNKGMENLYGFTKEDAVGQSPHLLLATQFPAPMEELQAILQRKKHWEGEVWCQRKNGDKVCAAVQWVLHLDAQEKPRAILEVHTDITARKKAELLLYRTEEFNRRVLESSPDCVEVLDLAGRLVFISPAGCQMLGMRDGNLVQGSYWPEFWGDDHRTRAERALRSALTGETVRFQGTRRAAGEKAKWWDVVLRSMLADDGRPEKLLVVSRDITESKQAEMANARESRMTSLRADIALEVSGPGESSAVLNNICAHLAKYGPAGLARIWLLSPDGQALELQASAGVQSRAELDHSHIRMGELEIGRIANEQKPYATQDLAHDPWMEDTAWLKRIGIVAFAGFPLVFQDQLQGVLGIYSEAPVEDRFLEELPRAAEAISQYIQRVVSEKEKSRLFREATEARNEALAASRAKDDFLAALSHELRTPLNPVLLLASECADDAAIAEEVRVLFRQIRNNVSLEAKLIDDLLDLTRINHGKLALEMKAIDLHGALRDAIGIVSSEIEEKKLSLTVRLEATQTTVLGDGVRLQQIFWNVLRNAVKFTPEGGQIAIDTLLTEDAQRIVVRVADSGVGLSAADVERIFSPFVQTTPRLGGLGLGLTISRRLTESHGGSMKASSPGIGMGSSFDIELPLAKRTKTLIAPEDNGFKPQLPPEDGVSPAAPRRRLLLIEDHLPTREALHRLLVRRDFEVVNAASAAEAHRCVAESDFDLVISDLGLPDGDGCELFAELRRVHPELIGLALSGYGMEDDILRSRAAGFSGHLTKPIDINSLARAIAALAPARH
ncbi:MAG TPA: chemotaxis protein CheB [Candidatus Limnocylindria bacterium]|nr:chemotaxis protein CheB [Candidatus Limnocylindria bacterium]